MVKTDSALEAHRREAVNRALAQVHAVKLARVPVGVMSGGELQRVRIAQALAPLYRRLSDYKALAGLQPSLLPPNERARAEYLAAEENLRRLAPADPPSP